MRERLGQVHQGTRGVLRDVQRCCKLQPHRPIHRFPRARSALGGVGVRLLPQGLDAPESLHHDNCDQAGGLAHQIQRIRRGHRRTLAIETKTVPENRIDIPREPRLGEGPRIPGTIGPVHDGIGPARDGGSLDNGHGSTVAIATDVEVQPARHRRVGAPEGWQEWCGAPRSRLSNAAMAVDGRSVDCSTWDVNNHFRRHRRASAQYPGCCAGCAGCSTVQAHTCVC